MPSKMRKEITYPFQKYNGCIVDICIVDVWELMSNFIPLIIIDVITLYMLGLKLIHVSKRAQVTELYAVLCGWYGVVIVTHCTVVIMGAMASQITSLTIVCSTVYSDADQRKHQSSASLAFVRLPLWVPGEFPAQIASNAEKCFHLMTSSRTMPL